MTQTSIEGAGTQKRELSQFFTPADLAERIVEWALLPGALPAPNVLHALEPSAGRGALVAPLMKRGVTVAAIELDPENVCALVERGCLATSRGDFLEFHAPEHPLFHLAVMNPPFEGGQTERHILHALKFAQRVVCHCPLTTLEGKARRTSLWSQVRLHRLAVCASRPKYGADGGKTAMCTIDVTTNGGAVGICEWRDVTVEVWP